MSTVKGGPLYSFSVILPTFLEPANKANSYMLILLSPTIWMIPFSLFLQTSNMPFATWSANKYVPNLSTNAFGYFHCCFGTKLVLMVHELLHCLAIISPHSFVRE